MRCIGPEFYGNVSGKRCIVNSGFIMGAPAAFARLAEHMSQPCPQPDANFTHGVDQALLMWAFYRPGQLGSLSIEAQVRGQGVINTMRYSTQKLGRLSRHRPPAEVRWPSAMPWTLYNDDNATVSPVVHQYDVNDGAAGLPLLHADHGTMNEKTALLADLESAALQWRAHHANGAAGEMRWVPPSHRPAPGR